MFFAKCDEFYPHCYHRAIFGAFAPAGHRKTPPPLPNAFSNRAAITHRALNHSSFYRSYLKIRIFVRDQGVTENQTHRRPEGSALGVHTLVCRGVETRAQRRYRAKRLF